MAAVAKFGLRLDQQVFFRCRVVWRVAINAAYVVLPVEGIRAIEVIRPGGMAGEALLIEVRLHRALRQSGRLGDLQ